MASQTGNADQNAAKQSSHSATMDEGGATNAASTTETSNASPSLKGKHKELDHSDSFDLEKATKQHRASISGKRLSGRPSLERLSASKRQSLIANSTMTALLGGEADPSRPQTPHRHMHESLVKHVSEWINNEKQRRAARKAKRKTTGASSAAPVTGETAEHATSEARRGSESSDGTTALEQLTNILERTMSLKSNEGSPRKRRFSHGHKLASLMKRQTAATSDTDYYDGEVLVPSCEAVLDNSKTLAYSGGGAEAENGSSDKSSSKEKEAWATFKFEIVRLTHTLRLKGWRRVPLDRSGEIEVERLSGALTNAVYVVSPPKNLPSRADQRGDALPVPKNPPPKLLLRIYGPQVEHLIDREVELQILKRLARKRIGPRLLGTFTNGRFEEFFHATTLTPQDLRDPSTSKQIAKRMRELHEGIDLEKKEREDGPFVFRNWDNWVERCEQVVTWLDQQILENKPATTRSAAEKWRHRGLVCGVSWSVFRKAVENYRVWLQEQYGGAKKLNQRLVFAHNDTQYGNILRLMPAGESPLLLPANEHKRLIVIDFEYANANVPGLEFANHFTEWCYNYHDTAAPYACNTTFYPTPAEQHRFICAYLQHNPAFKASSDSNPPTPHLGPLPSASQTSLAATAPSSSLSAFMLDSRGPPGEKSSYQEQEAERERKIEDEAKRLMAETRLWRLANSAQWVAWGIVQANIPGLPDFDEDKKAERDVAPQAQGLESATLEAKVQGEGSEEKEDTAEKPEDEEFDYLGYAQERAMFFWGDAVKLGIVKEEELPQDLRKRIKIVEF